VENITESINVSASTVVTVKVAIDFPEGAVLVSKPGERAFIIMPNGELVVPVIGFAKTTEVFSTMEEIEGNIGAMEYMDVSMREMTEADLFTN
jgi:hypothetical protein